MSVKESIAAQETNTRRLRSIGPKRVPKRQRQSTLKQIDMALDIQLKEILAALHDGQRHIPTQWQRGYNAAMTQVANYASKTKAAMSRPDLLDILLAAADIQPAHQVLEPFAGTGALVGMIPDTSRVTVVEYDTESRNLIGNNYPECHLVGADIRTHVLRHDFDRILFVAPIGAIEATKVIEAAARNLAAGGKLVTLIRQSACRFILSNIEGASLSEGFACDDGCGYCILTIEN